MTRHSNLHDNRNAIVSKDPRGEASTSERFTLVAMDLCKHGDCWCTTPTMSDINTETRHNRIYTHVRFSRLGTSQASDAWWKDAIGNSNSLVS